MTVKNSLGSEHALSVVVPALNEAAGIGPVLDRLVTVLGASSVLGMRLSSWMTAPTMERVRSRSKEKECTGHTASAERGLWCIHL